MNINMLSDKELATRIRNLETGEKVIAAENIPSGILQDVLIKRKELVKGISEEQAREIVRRVIITCSRTLRRKRPDCSTKCRRFTRALL